MNCTDSQLLYQDVCHWTLGLSFFLLALVLEYFKMRPHSCGCSVKWLHLTEQPPVNTGLHFFDSYLQQSFDNMEDEWGIFERTEEKSMTGSKITNVRSYIDERIDEKDPNSIISNLLKDYDRWGANYFLLAIFEQVLINVTSISTPQ